MTNHLNLRHIRLVMNNKKEQFCKEVQLVMPSTMGNECRQTWCYYHIKEELKDLLKKQNLFFVPEFYFSIEGFNTADWPLSNFQPS